MRLFRDESKLSPEYVPSRLLHREREMQLLLSFFKASHEPGAAYTVRCVIVGSVGTGKTSLAKLCGRLVEEEALRRGVKTKYIHVNCRIDRTLYLVLYRVASELGIELPRRGYSDEEITQVIVKHLNKTGTRVIIGLDEAEVLHSEEGGEAFYILSRMAEEINIPGGFSLVTILREPEVLDKLDIPTKSTLLGSVIHLKEYNYKQLLDILLYRGEAAFHEGVVMDEAMELIADVSSERGDARYAIDLLWRAGKFAEAEEAEHVTPEHVRKAIASIFPTIRRENLEYLSRDEKLVLLSCAHLLKDDRAYATSSELYTDYKLICEELNLPPKGYTRFWEIMHKLQDLGFIRIKVRSEGIRGRRSIVSLPDIPAALLEEELRKAL